MGRCYLLHPRHLALVWRSPDLPQQPSDQAKSEQQEKYVLILQILQVLKRHASLLSYACSTQLGCALRLWYLSVTVLHVPSKMYVEYYPPVVRGLSILQAKASKISLCSVPGCQRMLESCSAEIWMNLPPAHCPDPNSEHRFSPLP